MGWGEPHGPIIDRRGNVWHEDRRTEDDEFNLADLIGIAILLAVEDLRHLQGEIMATVEELQGAVTALQSSVDALVAAEAAEGPGLQPGEVAVPQSTIDSLHDQVTAAQAEVDQVTAADTPAAPVDTPPVDAPPADTPPA